MTIIISVMFLVMLVMAIPIIVQILYGLIQVILWLGSWVIALYVIYYITIRIFNL